MSVPEVVFQAHVEGDGWQPFVWNALNEGDDEHTSFAGTEGQSKRMEAIKIRVCGLGVIYQVHVADTGWMGWESNGSTAGTVGQSKRIEGIRIMLEGGGAGYHVEYKAHVEGVGWEPLWKRDGQVAGTEGQNLRMEAIRIRIVT